MQQEYAIITISVTNVPDKYEAEIRSCGLFEERTLKGYASRADCTDGVRSIAEVLTGILERADTHYELLKQVSEAGAEAVLYITHNSDGHHNLLFSPEILSLMVKCGLTLWVD